MLAVGSRKDERTGLRPGLGYGRGGEMEDSELEEGEAYSGQKDDAIDPDVALSYIDEKIQDILGHFQKDFEGGVSAENLGAKFGGYGSFLPAYQRSPSIWSHPRSPQKEASPNKPTSPDNAPTNGACQNPRVPSNAPVSLRNDATSISPKVDSAMRNETCISAPISGEFIPHHDPSNNHSTRNGQKILKVRIKVGSDKVLPRPNAAIYSDMGLDYSPSSSLEDSPGVSGGFTPENADTPSKSPMTIYQMMTSFPALDGYILSPLPESLLCLMENVRTYLKGSKLDAFHRVGPANYDVFGDETLPSRDGKAFMDKKTRSVGKKSRSSEIKILNIKVGGNDASAIQKKDVDMERSRGRELDSNVLNGQKPPSSKVADEKAERQLFGETGKGSGTSRGHSKLIGKDRAISPDLAKDESFVYTTRLDDRKVGNVDNDFAHLKGKPTSRTSSTDKVLEEGKVSSHKDAPFDQHKECRDKPGDCNAKSEVDELKASKDITMKTANTIKLNAPQNSRFHEQDVEKVLQAKDLISDVKRKAKENQTSDMQYAELPKEDPKSNCLSSKERKKSSLSKSEHSERKQNNLKSHQESSRILIKCHKDPLPNAKFEEMYNGIDPVETSIKDKVNNARAEYEKTTFAFSETMKKAPISEEFGKNSQVTPLMANVPISDAASAPSSHVVIQENWVCCDRCQKWRLLPFGTNPDHLPRKWLCTMLNWLPGMNKCSISEEETTGALYALYQAPVPGNQSNVYGPNSVASSGIVLPSPQLLGQNHDFVPHLSPTSRKKKHTSKDGLHVADHVTQFPNPFKKNQQVSIKNRTLNGVNQVEPNPSGISSFQDMSKSAEFYVGKDDDEQKENHKIMERYSDGGEFLEQNGKLLKPKSKRDLDRDGTRAPKRAKAEGRSYGDKDWLSDCDVTGKSASILCNGLSRDSMKHPSSSSFKDSKGDSEASLSVSMKKSKMHIKMSSIGDCKEDISASDTERSNKKDPAAKKRKSKKVDLQELQVHPESFVASKLPVDDRANFKEEIRGSKSRKEKKARASMAKGKESIAAKMDSEIDNNGRMARVSLSNSRESLRGGVGKGNRGSAEEEKCHYQNNVLSEQNLDCLGSLKRDLSYVQHSAAATSSSSKISGSHKSKSNFQEATGSPVESVSSSPLRISNADKFDSKTNPVGKGDAMNTGFSIRGSPRKCLDGEVDVSIDQSGTVRREKASSIIHRGSLDGYYAVDSGVLDATKRSSHFQDKETASPSVGKANILTTMKSSRNVHDANSPPEFEENNMGAGAVSTSGQHNKYLDDIQGKNHSHTLEKLNNHYHSGVSSQQKSGKGSSSRPKEKHRSSTYDVSDKNVKISDSFYVQESAYYRKNDNGCRYDAGIDSLGCSTYEDFRDKKCIVSEKNEKKRESEGKWSSECRWNSHSNLESQENREITLQAKPQRDIQSGTNEAGAISMKVGKSCWQDDHRTVATHEDEDSSTHFISDRTEKSEVITGRGKPQSVSHSGDKQETLVQDPQKGFARINTGRSDILPVGAVSSDALKGLKQPKFDNPNGSRDSSLRHQTPNGLDAPCSVKRDGNHYAATVALKEARDLKHTANRLKNEGLLHESTGLYFEAALKFLHVASLRESSSVDSGKPGENAVSMYSDTAKLCEFCAHEFEKCKDMAAAALVYKCMEVAYMKVVFCKHSSVCKDRHELQTALQIIPPGESPSSSASDIDNLNSQCTLDKATSTKGVNSPQIANNHVITARNRPQFERLLYFTQDVNYAMEASRKSHNAFQAAGASSEEPHYGPEEIASVKRVLDLSFHDVEGLLHLVRLSMDSISR